MQVEAQEQQDNGPRANKYIEKLLSSLRRFSTPKQPEPGLLPDTLSRCPCPAWAARLVAGGATLPAGWSFLAALRPRRRSRGSYGRPPPRPLPRLRAPSGPPRP